MDGQSVSHSNKGSPRKKKISRGGVLFALFSAAAILFVALLFAAFLGARQKEPAVAIRAENSFKNTLRAVTDIDYEPFSYVAGGGNYAGFDVELIAEVANRLEMNLELTLSGWTDANDYFKDGKADVFLNMESDSVAASRDMISTIPTIEKQYVVYGRREVSSVAELYGTRVASLHRMGELGLGDGVTYLDSYAEIFSRLSRGDFDFAICPIQVGNMFLQKMKLADIKPSYAVGHIYGAMALHSGDEALRDRLNAVISDLWREGFIERLDRKWISHRYQSASLSGFLRQNPRLLFVLALLILLLAFLAAGFAFQRKTAKEREAYAERLKENLDTISRQQAELIEAKVKAEASSRAKTLFLSNMSHDIRTPMNAIIGYTALAKKPGTDAAEIRRFLEKIDSSSKQLLALINDVLEMSRIESGKLELEESECDLRSVMDGARDMFSAQMAQKNISFSVVAEKIQDPIVLCDKVRLNRVLLNLISNACKFTPAGGSVAVTLRQAGSARDGVAGYELRVKDSGIGMSKEFAEKVFEAFERERTSTVSGIQGTGLGMAITKSILDLIGGTIEVQTEQGKGTEFIVGVHFKTLGGGGRVSAQESACANGESAAPANDSEGGKAADARPQKGANEADGEQSENAANASDKNAAVPASDSGSANDSPAPADAQTTDGQGAEASAQSAAADFSKMRVLLVDDMDVNRELAQMILESRGVQVETAADGKEAVQKVEAAASGHYNAVLMDIQMPVMNGHDAARAIRALGDRQKAAVPIIAMTANAFAEDKQAAAEAGMNAHVAKPIDEGELFGALARFAAR